MTSPVRLALPLASVLACLSSGCDGDDVAEDSSFRAGSLAVQWTSLSTAAQLSYASPPPKLTYSGSPTALESRVGSDEKWAIARASELRSAAYVRVPTGGGVLAEGKTVESRIDVSGLQGRVFVRLRAEATTATNPTPNVEKQGTAHVYASYKIMVDALTMKFETGSLQSVNSSYSHTSSASGLFEGLPEAGGTRLIEVPVDLPPGAQTLKIMLNTSASGMSLLAWPGSKASVSVQVIEVVPDGPRTCDPWFNPCPRGQACVPEEGEPPAYPAPQGPGDCWGCVSLDLVDVPESEPSYVCEPIVPSALEIWPNAVSKANSDPWLIEHHEQIRVLRPRVLVLAFSNAHTPADAQAKVEEIIAGLAEGSRHHQYKEPRAQVPAMLDYQVAKIVDMRDVNGAPGNSTLYPRENPVVDSWGLDYEQFFGEAFAEHYGYVDPDDPNRHLTLCELVDAGLIHELWLYASTAADVSAAEVLEIKPRYDAAGTRLPGPMSICAGNGCFDEHDVIPSTCTRSLRIGFIAAERGPGCYLEAAMHGLEGTGTGRYETPAPQPTIPELHEPFVDFAGFNLDERYPELGVSHFYDCPYGQQCMDMVDGTALHHFPNGAHVDPYVAHCGNVHFPPNGEHQYDFDNYAPIQTTCKDWWSTPGGVDDPVKSYDATDIPVAYQRWNDCMGPYLVWWMQNIPGLDNEKLDAEGNPMKAWWPYLFY